MSDDKDNGKPAGDGALTRPPVERYVTYAKWGLMGIGGLFVVKVLVSVILNPLILVGGAVLAGGAGWWALRRSRAGRSGAAEGGDADAAARSKVGSAARSIVGAKAKGALGAAAVDAFRREAEAEAEAELLALERASAGRAQGASAPPVALEPAREAPPKRDEAAAHAARLKVLERMKAEMEIE